MNDLDSKTILNEKIQTLTDNPYIISMNKKYTNHLVITGFVLQKPKFIKGKGIESSSFIIYQMNDFQKGIVVKSYNLMSYSQKCIEKLKNLESVAFLVAHAKYEYNPKLRTYYAQVYDLDIELETNEILLSPYERK